MSGAADTPVFVSAKQLADALPDGIVLVDSAGTVASINARLLEMTGYTEADLVGRSVDMLVPADRRTAHAAHRTRFTAHPTLRPMGTDLDIVCRRKDGSTFHADVALSPLTVGDGLHIVAAIRDATQGRAAEHARRETLERLHLLEQQERLGRDLHDGVIQSVFAVGMSLQSLLTRVDDPTVADRLNQSIRALDDTITELRTFIFGLGTLLTPETIRRELERLATEARSRSNIAITGVIDANALAKLGDHAQDLLLVAREALSNVQQHSRARNCDLSVRIHGDAVELTVTDDGRGFDTSASSGGLGLQNARSRAREIGADYEVDSSAAGTTVRLTLLVDS